jgi:hypothetical protein
MNLPFGVDLMKLLNISLGDFIIKEADEKLSLIARLRGFREVRF